MAAGVVAIAVRTGEVLKSRRVGLIAAALVLVQYPMFYYARTSNVDMGALFWTSLGLLLYAIILKDGLTTQRGCVLGAVAALAASTKDANYAAFVPIGIVVIVQHLRATRKVRGTLKAAFGPLAAAAIAAGLVYVVASGLVFRPGRYLDHIRFITHGSGGSGHYFKNPATPAGYLALGGEVVQALVDAMGWPMLLCATAGLIYWSVAARARLLWVLPALGIILLVIAPVRFTQMRFLIPVTYVLAFAAAAILEAGWVHQRRHFQYVTTAALIAVVGWAAIRGGDLTAQMLRDSRDIASSLIGGVVRPGDRVGHIVLANNLPRLPPGVRPMFLRTEDLGVLSTPGAPEFLISMPLRDNDPGHERQMPEDVFQGLMSGRLGYHAWTTVQGPSLFDRRPVTYLNPPVRIFVRQDVWESRLAGLPR